MLVVIESEKRVTKDHPLRRIKQLAKQAPDQLSPVFAQMYSALGRPSNPPERLLERSLLMALHCAQRGGCFARSSTTTSGFRWFLDLGNGRGQFRSHNLRAQGLPTI
jgi:hypothetical protein